VQLEHVAEAVQYQETGRPVFDEETVHRRATDIPIQISEAS